MIASHDSYTYLSSTNKLYNSVTGPWRAQKKTLQEQYKAGVRYFDIRLKREVKAGRNMWRPCHGLAELNYLFTSLSNVCALFDTFDGAYYRIILEKGNAADKQAFRDEINAIKDSYPHLEWCVIKEDWKTLFHKGLFNIVDYTCPTSSFEDILGFIGSGLSIENWARKNNPKITTEMIKDEKTVYFYDFV